MKAGLRQKTERKTPICLPTRTSSAACSQELFQLDQADLDFGIYRIMNQKRDEVVRFLGQGLAAPGAGGIQAIQIGGQIGSASRTRKAGGETFRRRNEP